MHYMECVTLSLQQLSMYVMTAFAVHAPRLPIVDAHAGAGHWVGYHTGLAHAFTGMVLHC